MFRSCHCLLSRRCLCSCRCLDGYRYLVAIVFFVSHDRHLWALRLVNFAVVLCCVNGWAPNMKLMITLKTLCFVFWKIMRCIRRLRDVDRRIELSYA